MTSPCGARRHHRVYTRTVARRRSIARTRVARAELAAAHIRLGMHGRPSMRNTRRDGHQTATASSWDRGNRAVRPHCRGGEFTLNNNPEAMYSCRTRVARPSHIAALKPMRLHLGLGDRLVLLELLLLVRGLGDGRGHPAVVRLLLGCEPQLRQRATRQKPYTMKINRPRPTLYTRNSKSK